MLHGDESRSGPCWRRWFAPTRAVLEPARGRLLPTRHPEDREAPIGTSRSPQSRATVFPASNRTPVSGRAASEDAATATCAIAAHGVAVNAQTGPGRLVSHGGEVVDRHLTEAESGAVAGDLHFPIGHPEGDRAGWHLADRLGGQLRLDHHPASSRPPPRSRSARSSRDRSR